MKTRWSAVSHSKQGLLRARQARVVVQVGITNAAGLADIEETNLPRPSTGSEL